MAAYALLNTFAGFKFDMTQGLIGFAPIRPENGHFRLLLVARRRLGRI